jgi:YD repeat-containing protein
MTRPRTKRSSYLSLVSRSAIVACASSLLAGSVVAQTTTTFTYDALGRLVVAKQGSATATEYAYDAADNRKTVTVNGGPTAVADSFSVIATSTTYVGDFDVLSNDTDPNFPDDALTITGVTGFGSSKITITGGGTMLHYSGNLTGANLTYTIRDSRNLTSSATALIEIIYCPGGVCP